MSTLVNTTAKAAPMASPAATATSGLTVPLPDLVSHLRASRGFTHKRDIAAVMSSLSRALPGGLSDTTLAAREGVLLGDDCAAIPDADGHLLLAIEGLVSDFVEAMPWFAGYSAVMVNLSDIAAMGGRPIAVVDALWSVNAEQAEPLLQGMAAASAAYGVPIVGGHSNHRAGAGQLAVAVLGRAQALLSSFAAQAGQRLLMAVDLRGQWQGHYPFWDASTMARPEQLRGDLALMAELAEDGLCASAKDISMAGTLGTVLMLLECAGLGGRIRLQDIPHPPGHGPLDAPDAWLRWLQAFPSYGYLLAVDDDQAHEVKARFMARGISCADIGELDASGEVWLSHAEPGQAAPDQALLWHLHREPFIGAPTLSTPHTLPTEETLA
jgi:AIR synthase-related protein